MIEDPQALVGFIKEQLRDFADCGVLAMSGGADSSLVAILCQQAFGAANVHTLHLPACERDLETFNSNSLDVAKKLGLHSYLVPIAETLRTASEVLEEALGGKKFSPMTVGNTGARVRMMMLYATANHLSEQLGGRVRVIGTGNLSEDFIGYDTKGGDALADIFPIGELFKSEVYQLLEFFRDRGVIAESNINRVPSAGFWKGQTDEGELGYSYAAMEKAIRKAMLSPETIADSLEAADKFVWERHCNYKHKHEAPKVLTLRKFCD